MGKQEDRFFSVIHDFAGEAGLVIYNQGNAVFPRNIFCPDDRELVPGDIFSELYRLNSPAGDGAANRDAVQHVRKCEVTNILRAAGDLFPAFFSLYRFSDEVHCHGLRL
jgi:hypothetical protein